MAGGKPSIDSSSTELLAELNRAKVAFQMRALCAALGMGEVRVEIIPEAPAPKEGDA